MPTHEDKISEKFIRTHSGLDFYIWGSDPEEICLEDIAHALSHICRFTGHTNSFYSVAQHSLVVMRIVEDLMQRDGHQIKDPGILRAALMHDASEAYLCDVASPIKGELRNYYALELAVTNRIAEKFQLSREDYAIIKKADWLALFAEAQVLLPRGDIESWTGWDKYGWDSKEYRQLVVENLGFDDRDPSWVRAEFLNTYHDLYSVEVAHGTLGKHTGVSGADAPESEAEEIKNEWRVANDKIVNFWAGEKETSAWDRVVRDNEALVWALNNPKGTMGGGGVEGVNPKDRIGIKKPSLYLVPPAANIYMALAFGDGAQKYGAYNWREQPVKASVYLSAALRHIAQYQDGEDEAGDSGLPHLAHALACLAILADATENDCIKDDRPLPGRASELLYSYTEE